MKKTKVIINGASGRMGQEAVLAVNDAHELELVAKLDHQDNLAKSIKETNADVVVDLTSPQSVYNNTKTIIEANAHPVIGTTGLTPQQIQELQEVSANKKLGGVIAPNFSIGALLMMRFASDAAKYLNDVEIIELHHTGKKDAPSGTAIKTAEMIAENRHAEQAAKAQCHETLADARGGLSNDIHIHSVRLPGLVAHQQVIFGGTGETLTIKHDSIDRKCFMPGIILACQKVVSLDKLVYGLDQLIF